MGRGEMPSEPGDSWFSPKCLEGQPEGWPLGVELCFGEGACRLPTRSNLRIPAGRDPRSEAVGAKIHRREGNNPDRRLRPLRAG